MNKIQVYIITYNRPELLVKAINSVLDQTFTQYELIVSDNSPNKVTQEFLLLHSSESHFRYIHRQPSLTGIEHINQVISEITSEYFMIFHDDDIMHPDMLETLYSCLSSNENLVAVGCNANIVKYNKKLNRKFTDLTENCIVRNRIEMIKRYLSKNQIVPFPSFLYRRQFVQKYFLDQEKGGKYADASFICDICKGGQLMLLKTPLMDYYFHKGQDSFTNNFVERQKLIEYFLSDTPFTPITPLLRKYRLMNIYNELISDLRKKGKISRCRFFLLFFLWNSTFNYFPKLCIRLLVRK